MMLQSDWASLDWCQHILLMLELPDRFLPLPPSKGM